MNLAILRATLFLALLAFLSPFPALSSTTDAVAPKPLFRDPIHDGAADPALIWNPHLKRWWMFYTNRRANDTNAPGVSWVHATRLGIAESADAGATWKYVGTAQIELSPEFGGTNTTHWAPEIFTTSDGLHHMLLTVVPGIFNDWNHPRTIVHLTSTNLLNWSNPQPFKLASDKVIDACIYRLPDGIWRMWYNNEKDRKSIYYADSPANAVPLLGGEPSPLWGDAAGRASAGRRPDEVRRTHSDHAPAGGFPSTVDSWTDKGKAVGDQSGEGPKVFRWKDSYWMITDVWRGLAVYRSEDALHWTRQPGGNLLEEPGHGTDDEVKGGHPDVIVSGDRAFLFYFTHPGRRGEDAKKDGYEQRRSSLQVVELKYADGKLTCNRDEPTKINLLPP